MSKEAMRAEADRLIKEAMEKKAITIKQGDTRIEATCGKCGGKIASRRRRGSFACRSPARNAGTSSRRCRLYCAARRLAAAFAAIAVGFERFCADCGRPWSFIALATFTCGFD
jgi:hypothetical protein